MIDTAVHLGIDVGKTGLRLIALDSERQELERWSVPTHDVTQARAALAAELGRHAREHRIASVGVSIFGPLQTDPARPDFGAVIESSEPAWSGVNIPQEVASALGQEVFFDFDVSAGALAEAMVGNGLRHASFVYLSIGTGVGAVHFPGAHTPGYAPQLGHMQLPRERDDLAFRGSCRFHGACLQGLASGRALAQRWGAPAEELAADHPAWDLQARYVARACANLVYSFAPAAILLGSSVGSSPNLQLQDVNRHLGIMLNGFLEPALREAYSRSPAVVRAALGANCSLIGAALLGQGRSGLRIVV